VILQIWKATTAERMKLDTYHQRQYCSPLNVLFSDLYYVDIARCSSAVDLQPEYSGRKRRFTNFATRENISQTESSIGHDTTQG